MRTSSELKTELAKSMPGSLSQRLRFDVEQTLKSLYADESLADRIDDLFLPFSNWVRERSRPNVGPLILGMSGAQGCGKTTFCTVVSHILKKGFDLNAVVLSLDDLYLTRSDRMKYSQEAHDLFSVRGVPGTHDVELADTIIQRLKELKDGEVMFLPVFDKSMDDRKPVHRWTQVEGPVDVVFFEGWCVGLGEMPRKTLQEPINELEATRDSNGEWRRLVNDHLKHGYRALFEHIDILLWMRAPNYEVVYEWRNKQERTLEDHLYDIHGGILDTLDIKVMSSDELKEFMQHYERLTRFMLSSMSGRADVVFTLNSAQKVIHWEVPIEH
ncbi:hypothetical protein GV054_03385 [Marinomonas mediterranea]|uniref:hypothetical protein n=1 Tax=Marinomonas mediterranea TaxID=119864 RepID=UPI00234B0191|nr:hypothetical protein [Marinomonas mediterranea]WCN12119.1 hypothetical protein GV054_03385 [Marinomonas mediterranea]